MALFRNEPDEWQRLDWMILQNGWISLYHRPEFLLIDITWFRKERYRVIELNCADWKDGEAMYADLKLKFRIKEENANSPDTLKESLKNVSILGAGLVVVLHHFDKLEKATGQSLLQVLAESSRFHLLIGERLLILVQVDNTDAGYEPVGAMPVSWNPNEWRLQSGTR